MLLMLTLVGIPISIIIMVGVGLWVIYRIARGFLRLQDGRAMPEA